MRRSDWKILDLKIRKFIFGSVRIFTGAFVSSRAPETGVRRVIRDSVGRVKRGGGRVHGLALAAARTRPRGMGTKAVSIGSPKVLRYVKLYDYYRLSFEQY